MLRPVVLQRPCILIEAKGAKRTRFFYGHLVVRVSTAAIYTRVSSEMPGWCALGSIANIKFGVLAEDVAGPAQASDRRFLLA